ncbi:MAG: restriction endonuclease subunit S [Candidatus Dojkabacteria bacterium]|nr:restriction endonuclease subunit S [Candidatus Dojkabacteria bacterium]
MTDKNSHNSQFTIPNGWVETTLGEVCEIIMGQSPKGETYNLEGNGLPFYQGITEFDEKYVKIKTYTSEPTKVIEPNTILFSVRAPVGRVNFTKHKSCIGRGNAGLKMNNGNQEFLFYLLRFLEKQIQNRTSGTVFDSISGKELKEITIIVPTNPNEQKAIASVLSAFDDKIELLREQNKTLEEIGQTIFKEWFGKYSPERPEELPEGWRVGKLGEEFDITIGRTPPRAESQWFSDTPTSKKWISIKDIVNSGTYIFNSSEYLTDEAIEKFNIPIIPENTTILSFKMTVGKLTITTEEMLSNEAIAHLKLKNDSVLSSEFIYLCLKNLNFNALGSTSSIVTAINSTMIKNLEVIIPYHETMKKFDEAIQPIFAKIKDNSEQIQTLARTRDTLLPKLMKGELRVSGFGNN